MGKEWTNCVSVFACDYCFRYYIIRKEYVLFCWVACASVCINIAWALVSRCSIHNGECTLHVHKSINAKKTNEEKKTAVLNVSHINWRGKNSRRRQRQRQVKCQQSQRQRQKPYFIPFDLYAHFQRQLLVYRLTMVSLLFSHFLSFYFSLVPIPLFSVPTTYTHNMCCFEIDFPLDEMSSNRFYNLHMCWFVILFVLLSHSRLSLSVSSFFRWRWTLAIDCECQWWLTINMNPTKLPKMIKMIREMERKSQKR